jgi:hypothetical protein
MARSLVVKHEETPGTSALLNTFLVLALLWMVGGAMIANAAPLEPTATPTATAP